MKKNIIKAAIICTVLLTAFFAHAAGQDHRLGIGANYWKAIKDIDTDDIDENGISWLATYQYTPGNPLSLEIDVELFREGFAGSTENVYAPQAYLIIGCKLYVGIGAGIYYCDGDFADDPFYALKAGLDIKLLPSVFLDINANYRFNEWEKLNDVISDVKSDTITLGAAIRVAF